MAATSEDGTAVIWNYVSGRQLATLTSTADAGWTVQSGQDGRLDTSEIENVPWSWVFPDNPLKALPPESFMRDYYLPGILRELVVGKRLPTIRPLASLNRVQPLVEVEKAEWLDAPQGKARVTVKVSSNTGMFEQDGEHVEVRLL